MVKQVGRRRVLKSRALRRSTSSSMVEKVVTPSCQQTMSRAISRGVTWGGCRRGGCRRGGCRRGGCRGGWWSAGVDGVGVFGVGVGVYECMSRVQF
jgi:hypothetical protein